MIKAGWGQKGGSIKPHKAGDLWLACSQGGLAARRMSHRLSGPRPFWATDEAN